MVLELSGNDERAVLNQEFERAAKTFGERTAGRFDHMNVLSFAGVPDGATVMEVGAGTGNFLAMFAERAARLIGVDVTQGMLQEARKRYPDMELVLAEGAALPFPSRSIDFVTTAQVLHHVRDPLPVVKEMRRVVSEEGRVLVLDQVATEKAEEAAMMNELDRLRDPSHAGCRPPSAFRIMLRAAGLEIEAEEIHESTERFSTWMSPDEFPEERVAAVADFVREHGHETGMSFEQDSGDWLYTRRRIMLLARR